jgi:hypothetical protein
MQIKFTSTPSSQQPNLLRKIVTIIMTLALAVVEVMFSAILLSIILVVVVLAGSYLWWKTRAIRKQMKTFAQQAASMHGDAGAKPTYKGEVIEGEVIHVDKSFAAKRVSR